MKLPCGREISSYEFIGIDHRGIISEGHDDIIIGYATREWSVTNEEEPPPGLFWNRNREEPLQREDRVAIANEMIRRWAEWRDRTEEIGFD